LWLDLSGRTRGSTPENELAVAEAVATNVSESMARGVHHLKFSVAGRAIEYDGAQPHYPEVRSAVQSDRAVRVWVSKKNEAPIPLGQSVTLYKMHAGNRPVLNYAEVAAHRAKQGYAVPIVGGVLLAFSGLCTVGCVYTQGRHAKWISTGSIEGLPDRGDAAEGPRRKVTWLAVILSAAMYAIIIGVNFAPAVRAKFLQAYGPQPLGLPVLLVVSIVETFLFLPMPWVFWHAGWIAYAAHSDGRRFSLTYILMAGNYRPELRRSQLVCSGGLLYFTVVVAAWILCAASRGI